MNSNFEAAIAPYRKRVRNDEPVEQMIVALHDDGFTITDSMKAVRALYGISLGESKQLVTGHPIWYQVVKANEPFHEELVQVMTDATLTDDVELAQVTLTDSKVDVMYRLMNASSSAKESPFEIE